MEHFRYIAPCLFGLEGILAQEMRRLGFADVAAQDGRVAFSGTLSDMARANIHLRTAERVCLVMGEYEAESFDALFDGARALPWELFISKTDAFPVTGHSIRSTLFSVRDCQSILKKAVAERLKAHHGTELLPESGCEKRIRFQILNDKAVLMLDTTGHALHKRGYREKSIEAPLRETLAAALLQLMRWRAGDTLVDPFCGSGTIAIEAAMLARGIAPGSRRRFAAETWPELPAGLFRIERDRARMAEKSAGIVDILAYDIDPRAVELTLANAKKAGVGGAVRAEQRDACDLSPMRERGVIICNPPYGERLSDKQSAQRLYRRFGRTFSAFSGWSAGILTPEERFEMLFGRRADKNRKLYNGMIKCYFYQYFGR